MKDENGIYIDQPILRQIGDLGEKYDAWVHTPLSGQARFFKNQILEDLTRCPWYVIPLVWIPVFLVCCYWSLMVCMVPWWTYLNYWCMGIVGWQVVEYLVHRFIFHSVPTYKPLIVLHFLFHGNHHKFPMDKSRLVFPPLPASWFGIALYALAATFLPAGKTHAYFSGMIIGYIAYDMIHYFIHHGGAENGSFLHLLKRHHMEHHYKNTQRGFGISSTFFDIMFDTTTRSQWLS